MAIATENTLLLHIPKTGGVFVKEALESCDVSYEEIGTQHDHFPKLFDYESSGFFNDRLIYSFVRHPITWYQSRWAFRLKHGWQAIHPLDYHCASNDFKLFVSKVLAYRPDGWCNFLFGSYLHGDWGRVSYVGRTEFLADDLIDVMSKANEPINGEIIRNMPRSNHSTSDGKKSSDLARYSSSLFDRVMAVESSIVQEYYNDFTLDKNEFIDD